MKTIADHLVEQITEASRRAQQILAISGFKDDEVIYAFATLDTLVINCEDRAIPRLLDDEHFKLRQAIASLNLAIHTIVVENSEHAVCYW
jgi:UDP-2,3-diacylglucosamine pyrophosphatase LpxH